MVNTCRAQHGLLHQPQETYSCNHTQRLLYLFLRSHSGCITASMLGIRSHT